MLSDTINTSYILSVFININTVKFPDTFNGAEELMVNCSPCFILFSEIHIL